MDWSSNSKYLNLAIGNFIILAFFGVLLRFMQLFPIPGGNYMFLLHAHSHFAFAGWMFFSLALLIVHHISTRQYLSGFRSVFIWSLVSAFGMLFTFSMQGYKPLSIFFSTLFILVTYRFTFLVFKSGRLKRNINELAYKLIAAALIFLCVSSAGPFALAPLTAAGFRNNPVYQDAIYFYLHFQMNGFMLLAALGLFAAGLPPGTIGKEIRVWLRIFIFSAIPSFFIFTLWADPPDWFWITALLGTSLNLVSWLRLTKHYKSEWKHLTFLQRTALAAIFMKVIMQVVICIPAIGEWAFSNRNLIVGYVHLLTLGCVMPLILDQFMKRGFLVKSKSLHFINRCFVLTVSLYLGLLFTQPVLTFFSIAIPGYQLSLLVVSILFLLLGFLYYFKLRPVNLTNLREEEPPKLELV